MKKTVSKTQLITRTAIITAMLCVLGPISLPIGPVPISLTNLAIYLMIYMVGTKGSLISYLLYMFIGFIGAPVFSGFQGGPQKLFGPTGGYLFGFFVMIIIAGVVIDRYYRNRPICVVAMVVATIAVYIMGTAWLSYSIHISFGKAFALGVLPFAVEDFIKIVIAAFLGSIIRDRFIKTGLYNQ